MNNLSQFHFETLPVRAVIGSDGEPQFVLSDVCAVLEISKHRDAASRLDDDERGSVVVDTLGGPQQTTTINESGLYSLILTSRKPQAKRFKKWVTAEVLPTIRKTGNYGNGTPRPAPAPGSAEDTLAALEILARSLNLHGTARANMYRKAIPASGNATLATAVMALDYSIDAPVIAGQAVSETSYRTASASQLLKEHDLFISAKEFNRVCEAAGFLQRLSRQGRSEVKLYWNITEDGLRYGKNVVSPANPRETQPHWYADTFPQLLEELGLG